MPSTLSAVIHKATISEVWPSKTRQNGPPCCPRPGPRERSPSLAPGRARSGRMVRSNETCRNESATDLLLVLPELVALKLEAGRARSAGVLRPSSSPSLRRPASLQDRPVLSSDLDCALGCSHSGRFVGAGGRWYRARNASNDPEREPTRTPFPHSSTGGLAHARSTGQLRGFIVLGSYHQQAQVYQLAVTDTGARPHAFSLSALAGSRRGRAVSRQDNFAWLVFLLLSRRSSAPGSFRS